MPIDRLRIFTTVIFCALVLSMVNHNLYAVECFSPPPSVLNGRGLFEDIVSRHLSQLEQTDLKSLFESLEGDWAGTAEVFICDSREGVLEKQTEAYSLKAEIEMDRSGNFFLGVEFYSREKNSRHQDGIRLYLNGPVLSMEPNNNISDIEILAASYDELSYVKKSRRTSGSGAPTVQEFVITIKKLDDSSFVFERVFFLRGRLISINTWHLEKQ